MNTSNDGGPAFPLEFRGTVDEYRAIHRGMTLRDYFAGQAAAGWLASACPETDVSAKQVAEDVYKLADAMLKERDKMENAQ